MPKKLPQVLSPYIDPNWGTASVERLGRRGFRPGEGPASRRAGRKLGPAPAATPLYPITDPELAGDLNPDVRAQADVVEDGPLQNHGYDIVVEFAPPSDEPVRGEEATKIVVDEQQEFPVQEDVVISDANADVDDETDEDDADDE